MRGEARASFPKTYEIFFFSCLFIAFLNFVPATTFAQLLLEEGKVTLNVHPGETVMNSLSVHNTSPDESIGVKVYWEDFVYVPPFDGKKNFLPPGATDYSLNKWISFSPTEFTLAPNTKKKITYSMKIPRNIQGGYYGVLFFEQASNNKQETTGVRLISRVGCLFFVEAKDKIKKARVSDIKFVIELPSSKQNSKTLASVDSASKSFRVGKEKLNNNHMEGNFSNSGNIVLIPEGVYYFMSKEDTIVDRGEIKKLYLPPKGIGTFTVDLPNNLKEGKYTLVITFDLQEGDSVVKEIDFSKGPSSQIKILQERD